MKLDTKGKNNRGRAAKTLRHFVATSLVFTILFASVLGDALGAKQETTQNTATAPTPEHSAPAFCVESSEAKSLD